MWIFIATVVILFGGHDRPDKWALPTQAIDAAVEYYESRWKPELAQDFHPTVNVDSMKLEVGYAEYIGSKSELEQYVQSNVVDPRGFIFRVEYNFPIMESRTILKTIVIVKNRQRDGTKYIEDGKEFEVAVLSGGVNEMILELRAKYPISEGYSVSWLTFKTSFGSYLVTNAQGQVFAVLGLDDLIPIEEAAERWKSKIAAGLPATLR